MSCTPNCQITFVKTESGAYFIDRNPKAFAAILSYLRTREVFPNYEGVSLKEVATEASYFGLDELWESLGGQDKVKGKEVIIVVPNIILHQRDNRDYDNNVLELFALMLDENKTYKLSAVPEMKPGRQGNDRFS